MNGSTRTIVLNRKEGGDASAELRAAEIRFTRFFNNTPMAIASSTVTTNHIRLWITSQPSRAVRLNMKAATANAREAADTFAKDSGVKVGGIKSATQGLFSISSPVSDYDAESSLMKKVRVVTRVQFFIE